MKTTMPDAPPVARRLVAFEIGTLRIRPGVILLAEVALAALLCLVALGSRSFWLDESVSVTIAGLDWSAFVDIIQRREANLSLYHLLLSWWVNLGESEWAVRSLSVIMAVVAIPVLYAVARRVAGTRVALLAGFLLAINPMFVRYGQEARGYALCLLLVTVASYLFVRGLQQPSWWVWVAYALAAALAAYAHFFALLIPPAHAASLLFLNRHQIPWRKAAVSAGLLVLSLVFLFYLLAANEDSGIGWTSGSRIGRLFVRIHDRPVLALAIVILAAAILFAAWKLLSRRLGDSLRSWSSWSWAFPIAWIVVPLAIVTLVAIAYQPLFVLRYFIVCLPGVMLLLAMLVMLALRLRRRAVAAGVVAVIVLASAVGLYQWYTAGQEEDWRGATRYVVSSAEPGDGVMLYAPFVRIPFALYLGEAGGAARAPEPVYPADGWDVNSIKFDTDVALQGKDVAAAAAQHDRVWLVVSHAELFGQDDPGYDATLAGLQEAGFEPVAERDFDGVHVELYEPAAG
jgi:4-amino-4-deoxy-L-arabinose transferase-like glycosyltransferase